jgi:two-component system NtrC family sensor kinase
LSRERILVVDDRAENVEFIADYVLKPNGYIPLIARDGAEGFKKALDEMPDLILLDMQMPKMTGIQVLEALNERDVHIPVILMTFHGSEELAVRMFRLGVKDYVIKPFEVTEMLDAIERALREVRLRQERDELFERLLDANRKLKGRIQELDTLSSVGQAVASLLDLERLLGRLVDAAVYLTGAEEGWLMLLDTETDELYVRAAKGIEEKQARSLRLRVQDSLAGAVIRSGEPVIIDGRTHRVKTAYLVNSLIAVPLKIGGQAIGVLSVDLRVSDRSFSSSAPDLLSALADYAAIAIQNAELFTKVEDGRRRLQAILTGTSDAILVTDPHYRIVLLNRSAARLFGVDTREVIGELVPDVVESRELCALFAQAADPQAAHSVEVPSVDDRTYNANLTAVSGIGYVVVMQDITHLKELERLKNEFVSNVSHDLRSPMTSIRGFVDLLEMAGPLTDEQQTFVAKIRKGVIDITALIDDLLDLGRIEAGVAFEPQAVDLGQLIVETSENLRGHASSKEQRLLVHVPPDLPAVWGNRLRLGQVVSNLVGNAIKYTPERGTIKVWAEEQEGQVLVFVQDDGIGISPEDQAKLFQKFYRVHSPQTRDIPGTGLGLALTKSIVEMHEGRIWVDSKLGQGSTFVVVLPAHDLSGAETVPSP